MSDNNNNNNNNNNSSDDKRFDAEWSKFTAKWNELKEFDRMDKEWKDKNKPKPKK